MEDNIIVILKFLSTGKQLDIQVPLWVSANEFVISINEAYGLEMDTLDYSKCYLKSENPVAFLRGNKKLSEFGLRNGSIINIL